MTNGPPPPASGSERPHRVALIVAHGVADQKPFETPRQVIEQLQHLPRDSAAGVSYAAFVERAVTIPVVWPRGHEREPKRCWDNAKDAIRKFPGDWSRRRNTGPNAQEDAAVMDGQLEYLRIDQLDPAYQTTCAQGTRSASGRTVTHIDVYEMYWADFSRLATGIGRFVRDFYQLLFHLPWLGWGTVDSLSRRDDTRGSRSSWRLLDIVYRAFGYLLAVHVPLINLLLLAITLFSVVFALPGGWRPPLATGVAVVGVFAFGSWWLYRSGRPLHWGHWLATSLLALAAGWLGQALGRAGGPDFFDLLLLAECLGVLAIGMAWLLDRYGASQPCATPAGWLLVGVLAVALVIGAFVYHASPRLAADAVSFAAIVFFMLLGIASAVLFVLSLMILLLTVVLWHRHGRAKDAVSEQVRRGLWTGLIAAAIPLSIFTFVTASLWVGLADRMWQFLPIAMKDEMLRAGGLLSSPEFMSNLVNISAMPVTNLFTVLVSMAAVLSIWLFGPSPLADLFRVANDQDARITQRQGKRLDACFGSLRVAGLLMIAATMIVLPLGFFLAVVDLTELALARLSQTGWSVAEVPRALVAASCQMRGDMVDCAPGMVPIPARTGPLSHSLLIGAGGLLAVFVGVLVAFKGLFEHVFQGLTTVLDIALDVDNYIRKYPKTLSMRARLVTRFASLLRHVSVPPSGIPYDAIVIVAHSQGSVIVVESLRLFERLKRGAASGVSGAAESIPDPLRGVPLPPIHLTTFGSPLRQLYLQRFPLLYQFVNAPVGSAEVGSQQVTACGPDPGELLNVRRWVNGYRSADYVGRNLWEVERMPVGTFDRWVPGEPLRAAGEYPHWFEVCLGAGAHNCYFQKEAPQVGQLIDSVIALARPGAST